MMEEDATGDLSGIEPQDHWEGGHIGDVRVEASACKIPQFYMDMLVKTYPDVWLLQDATGNAPVNYPYALYGVVNTAHYCKIPAEKVGSHLFRDLEKHASGNKTLADCSQDTHDQTIRWMAESALQNPVLNTTPIDATWQWFAFSPPLQ